MATCSHCGKPLFCACAKARTAGELVQSCSTKAAIWAIVLTESGRALEGIKVSLDGKLAGVPTDKHGVVRFEDVEDGKSYPVTLPVLEQPAAQRYALPTVPKKDVTAKAATIKQILFELPEHAKLKVKLIAVGFSPLPAAEVVLSRVVGKTLEEVAKKAHVGGIADFETKPARAYRVTVKLEPDADKKYAANIIDFELLAMEDKVLEVEIHRYFEKVRFIGLCLATVPRQIWDSNDALVLDYEARKISGAITEPDIDKPVEYTAALTAAWDAELEHWKARYNGPASDEDDIDERVAFMHRMIDKAAVGHTDDTELKVFVAPECFFLGRYGAYTHDLFGDLIKRLQRLVQDAKWRAWIFVFGTANGFYTLEDGSMQFFNISPVIRGGWRGKDPDEYTKLQQKSQFSAEIIKEKDLVEAKEKVRTQITEEMVGKDFQATENEELMGHAIGRLRDEIDDKKTMVKTTKIDDWKDDRWNAIKSHIVAQTKGGMTPFVRRLRDVKLEDGRRHPDSKAPYGDADLRYLLQFYLGKETTAKIAKQKGDNFNFRDYAFSCLRIPGPWLDDVVNGEPKDQRHTKLTFGLETCADHGKSRLLGAMRPVAEHERPDIQIVPSAGMFLTTGHVCVVEGGFAFNCDGWNASAYGKLIAGRKANIVFELDERQPRQSGYNPLMPHTELAQKVGTPKFINDLEKSIAVEEDVSHIFSYRNAEERKAYAEKVASLNEQAFVKAKGDAKTSAQANRDVLPQKEQDIRKIDAEIVLKEDAIKTKEKEIAPSTSSGPLDRLRRELTTLQGKRTKAVEARNDTVKAAEEQDKLATKIEEDRRKNPPPPAVAAPPRAGKIHVYPSQPLPTKY